MALSDPYLFPATSFEIVPPNAFDPEKANRDIEKLRIIIKQILAFNPALIDITFLTDGQPDISGKVAKSVLRTIDLVREFSTEIPIAVHVTANGLDIEGVHKFVKEASREGRNVHDYILLSGDPVREGAELFPTPCYAGAVPLIKGVSGQYADMGMLHKLKIHVAVEIESYFPNFKPAKRFQEKIDAGIIEILGQDPVSTVKSGIANYRHTRGGYAALCKTMEAAGIKQEITPGYMSTIFLPQANRVLLDRDKNLIKLYGKTIFVDRQNVRMPDAYLDEFAGLKPGAAVRERGREVMYWEMRADAQQMPDWHLPRVHIYTMNELDALIALRKRYPGIDVAPGAQSGVYTPRKALLKAQFA